MFIDIGQLTIEQVKEYLYSKKSFECPGRHVELYDMLSAYDWEWTPVWKTMPLSDEEFVKELRSKHPESRIFVLGDELDGLPRLQTLRNLNHVGFGEFESATHCYVRHDSPKGKRRFYVEIPKQPRD